jgi:hypothetical protein
VSPQQSDQTVAFYPGVLGQHGVTRCAETERLGRRLPDRQSGRHPAPDCSSGEDSGL